MQWTGSQSQKDALRRVAEMSQAVHSVRRRAMIGGKNDRIKDAWEQAFWRLLRAETSCNFFWGEAWVPRCHQDLNEAWTHLEKAESQLKG